jgi:hypothetical protein
MKPERRNPNDGTRQVWSSPSMDIAVSTVTLDTALASLASTSIQQREDTSSHMDRDTIAQEDYYTSILELSETSTHRVSEFLVSSPYLKLSSRSYSGCSNTQHSLSDTVSIQSEPILSSSKTCTSLHHSRPTSYTAASRTIKDSSVNMPLPLNNEDSSYTQATRSSVSVTSKDAKSDDSALSSLETHVVKAKDRLLSFILQVELADLSQTDDTMFSNPSESNDSNDDAAPGQYDLKGLAAENKNLFDLIRLHNQK